MPAAGHALDGPVTAAGHDQRFADASLAEFPGSSAEAAVAVPRSSPQGRGLVQVVGPEQQHRKEPRSWVETFLGSMLNPLLNMPGKGPALLDSCSLVLNRLCRSSPSGGGKRRRRARGAERVCAGNNVNTYLSSERRQNDVESLQ